MLITSSLLADVVLFTSLSLWLLYKYLARNNDYWAKRGVHFVEPKAFLGNAADLILMRNNMATWLKKVYDSSTAPFSGFFVFDEPHLLIRSPELVKKILMTDFQYFKDRTTALPKHNAITQNLIFVQKSPRWKVARAKVTPVLTSGKIKGMFPLITNVGKNFARYLKDNAGVLDSKRFSLKYGTDVTARCFFGVDAHAFEDDNSDFNKLSREMFGATFRNGISQTAFFCKQGIVDFFKLEFIAKWIENYLSELFWSVLKQREKTGVRGNDLVDILAEFIKTDEYFSKAKENVVAHVIQFYVGGYETTSTTISYALYELALNPEVQEKAREEILRNLEKHQGFTYEGLKELTYLDMVIQETLRKYPALPFLDRRCDADYKLPDSDLVIKKGTPVFIPMYSIHRDEKYFPEPHKFKPERFANKNEYNKDGIVYMPFGTGPRVCIGERFGFLSSKIGVASVLANLKVSACPQTPSAENLEFDPRSFLMNPKGGLLINVTPLSGH